LKNQLSNHSNGGSPAKQIGLLSNKKLSSGAGPLLSKALSSGPMDSAMIEKER